MKKFFVGLRPHFLCSVGMFIFISMIVLEQNQYTRTMLLVPVVTLFLIYQVLYSMEIVSAPVKKRESSEGSKRAAGLNVLHGSKVSVQDESENVKNLRYEYLRSLNQHVKAFS